MKRFDHTYNAFLQTIKLTSRKFFEPHEISNGLYVIRKVLAFLILRIVILHEGIFEDLHNDQENLANFIGIQVFVRHGGKFS